MTSIQQNWQYSGQAILPFYGYLMISFWDIQYKALEINVKKQGGTVPH